MLPEGLNAHLGLRMLALELSDEQDEAPVVYRAVQCSLFYIHKVAAA